MVDVRMRRQELLASEGAPDLLERMPEIPKLRNVTLQVLPFDAGAYPTAGSFTVLAFPEQEDPDVVHREGLTDSVYLEEPNDVALYTKAFDQLRALVLAPQRSALRITRLLEGNSR